MLRPARHSVWNVDRYLSHVQSVCV